MKKHCNNRTLCQQCSVVASAFELCSKLCVRGCLHKCIYKHVYTHTYLDTYVKTNVPHLKSAEASDSDRASSWF